MCPPTTTRPHVRHRTQRMPDSTSRMLSSGAVEPAAARSRSTASHCAQRRQPSRSTPASTSIQQVTGTTAPPSRWSGSVMRAPCGPGMEAVVPDRGAARVGDLRGLGRGPVGTDAGVAHALLMVVDPPFVTTGVAEDRIGGLGTELDPWLRGCGVALGSVHVQSHPFAQTAVTAQGSGKAACQLGRVHRFKGHAGRRKRRHAYESQVRAVPGDR